MPRKVYVEVIAKTTVEGKLIPLSIKWEDGMVYEIDKVLDSRLASSKVGGDGIRYACQINFKQTYLFKEHDRWFVEGR